LHVVIKERAHKCNPLVSQISKKESIARSSLLPRLFGGGGKKLVVTPERYMFSKYVGEEVLSTAGTASAWLLWGFF